MAVRQLVLAKAIDNLNLRLGHQATFPFIVQPLITADTVEIELPIDLIWDIHASLPKKWEKLRLSKIKRISGLNDPTDGYSGKLRLIFSATIQNSLTEVSIFQADYQIDSVLTFQSSRLTIVNDNEEDNAINQGESETVAGFIVFKTLDTARDEVINFLDAVAPVDITDSNSDGIYDNPAIYEISDTVAGGTNVTDDYSLLSVSHGTGILTDSAWNSIPSLDSDSQSWINSFNYPFDIDANRTSSDGIQIPLGLFREFDIVAPAGDQPTDDVSGLFYPVWISRIERIGTGTSQLRFYFATYNITDSDAGGSPSSTPVEFATLDLLRNAVAGDVVEIVPIMNLMLKNESDTEAIQGFGRGHVVLSSLWGSTTDDVLNFFDDFATIVDDPNDTSFTQGSTRISSFGISRVPKYTPTIGQSRALLGSTSRRTVAIPPSYDNRYVTEQDQGLGNRIDLDAQSGIVSHAAIDRYGHSGALCHKIVRLVVDSSKSGSSATFYDDFLLPRLRILLGRDPVFGDEWFNGTRWLKFNGDTWMG